MAKKIRVWDGTQWQDVAPALPYTAVHSAQASMPSTGVDGQIWLDTDGTLSDTAFVPLSTIDAKGDLLVGAADNTVNKLTVGSNNTVLTADSSTATGLKWATPAAGGMTELATGSLSGSSVTISSISGSYVDLALYLYGHSSSGGTDNAVRFNGVTSNSYQFNYIDTGGSAVFQSGALTRMYCNPGSATPGICFAKIEIFNYASTSNWKNVRFIGMRNGLGWNGGGIFESGNAITSIEIGFNGTATFASGTYKLYGVK